MTINEGGNHWVVSQKEKEFAYKELDIFRQTMPSSGVPCKFHEFFVRK
jgi:hypothetical protein